MNNIDQWDWHTPLKTIPIKEWQERFNWVEEFVVSPDGEKIAAIVNLEETQFGVCENSRVWDQTFEKIWSLKYLPDGRLAAIVSNDEEWTVCVDGVTWDHWFDYVWDLKSSEDGTHICVAVQTDMTYGMAVDDVVWETFFENISGMILSPQGHAAAVVQVASLAQADIQEFSKGVFSVAVDGVVTSEKYMNIWDLSFDSQGTQIAFAIRKNRSDYSIVNGDNPWEAAFESVWKPEFVNGDTGLLAPVRLDGKWGLYKNGIRLWDAKYPQLWNLEVHNRTGQIAAIVCDSFGRWTIRENKDTWKFHCDTMISEMAYSKSGNNLAIAYNEKGNWDICLNDCSWGLSAQKVWLPSISLDDATAATRFEKKGRHYLAVDGKICSKSFDQVFQPHVSSDGQAIILTAIKDGVYTRQVLSKEQVV